MTTRAENGASGSGDRSTSAQLARSWPATGLRTAGEGKEDATKEYENFAAQLLKFRGEDNLSGAVYTQLTDVENEMNGFFTYDRKVEKLDRERVAKVNRALWQTASDASAPPIVNPTDGGALNTPDEGAVRKKRP